MKNAVITGPRKAALIDVPDPEPRKDWVVVKIHAAPMCTEYKSFIAGDKVQCLGHEAAGEVVAVAQPGGRAVGDRVVVMPLFSCGQCALCIAGDFIHCQLAPDFTAFTGQEFGSATMAQYIVKPAHLLPRIPKGLSYERASLACCALGASFGACELLGVDGFTTLLVTGLGPVGLGAVVNGRFRGARVIGVECTEERAARAREMGARVIDPRSPDALEQVRALTGGPGVDAAIDCSGTVAAERFCIDAVRRKGKVAFVGECNDDLKVRASPDFIRKGLTVIGSWHYNLNAFPRLMKVIQESPLLDLLVSHTFPLSEIQEALELSAQNRAGKIILKPWT